MDEMVSFLCKEFPMEDAGRTDKMTDSSKNTFELLKPKIIFHIR